ncbi:TetR/AcrR family transcriptional regulator [Pediococcus argentinicus]|nr:TetR/AcrR family transcriptional regulator [Pediococcus argentinicus]
MQRALVDLLSEKTFGRITIQDLVSQSSVGRSTLYEHHYNKYDLVQEMIEEQATIFQKAVQVRFANDVQDGFQPERLAQIVEALLPNRKAIVALYHLNVDEDSLERRYHQIIHEMVVQNQTIKKYAKNTQVSLEYLSDLYTNIALTQIM